MKQSILFLFIAFISLYSCKQPAKESFTVSGDIEDLTDPYIYFRWQAADSVHMDSALVADGKFTFNGKAPNPEMATLYRGERKGYLSFFLENGEIKITGTADSLSEASITGSQSQKDFEGYQAALQAINDQRSDLYDQYSTAKKNNDSVTLAALDIQIDDLSDQSHEKMKEYIGAHPQSYASLYALQRLAYSTPYKELNNLYSGLDHSVQNGLSGKKFADRLTIMEKTAVGKTAPDFSQNNVAGESVSLSDFRGKYVLVDFWASWCGPCRAENPNVVKAYEQYKDDGFTILGVSLDSEGDNWKKAIEADHLTWTHVSDLKGWKNEVAQQYGVNAIPANYLIDPQGVIIAHNLRGEELADKLAEVLN